MSETASLGKKILLEFIDYLRYKVENDALTMEEAESFSRTLIENLELSGTAEDFSRFYGRSVDSVRHVLHRRVFDTPKRRVMHSFRKFREAAPPSWKKPQGGG